jgi:hypothetical protein
MNKLLTNWTINTSVATLQWKQEKLWEFDKCVSNLKGILSTKIVIFFIPKIIVVFRTDLHKMKINTELRCKRYDFLTKKTQNYRYQNYCPGWQEFKSIHISFYVNPYWACTLFRNNKQHVVLGQKRKCQRVQESGLWRIHRERWIEVKYLPNGTNAGYM